MARLRHPPAPSHQLHVPLEETLRGRIMMKAIRIDQRDRPTAHERLTPEEVKAGWLAGDYTASGYLYHLLRAMRKDGWWLRINNVSEFCEKWAIGRKAFYRAKAKLTLDGRMEERIDSLDLRVIPGSGLSHLRNSCFPNGTTCFPNGTTCFPYETNSLLGNTDPPESLTQQEIHNSTDLYQIYSDLSQAKFERERTTKEDKALLNFVIAEIKGFSGVQRPRPYAKACLEDDREYWSDLYQQHLQRPKKPQRSSTSSKTPSQPEAEKTKRTRQDQCRYYQQLWGSVPSLRAKITEHIAANPEWGLVITAIGVELKEEA